MSLFQFLLILFWTTLVGVSFLTFRFGGEPEKWGMTIIILGSLASALMGSSSLRGTEGFEFYLLLADGIVLVALCRMALFSVRYWPLWATSFHMITVMTHAAALLTPTAVPKAYLMLQGFWIYPMFITILAGVYGHKQAQVIGR